MTPLNDRERALRAVALDLAMQASRIQLQLAVLARDSRPAENREPVVKALEESAQGLNALVRRLADVVEPSVAV